jgi:type II restriction/modification system DNA methylase subunit YeeA
MLVYAFDLLYAIYEEEGYPLTEIPGLILEKNLYGIEIDKRAGELAAFALVMKARQKYRRFLRQPIQPNILVLENIKFDRDELKNYQEEIGVDLFTASLFPTLRQFEEADNFGSLIRPDLSNISDILQLLEAKNVENNLFLSKIHQKVLLALKQVDYLSPKYHVVIANPPYMGGKGMNPRLKAFLDEQYPDVKSDLFSAFILRNTELALPKGQLGYMSPFVWMFISSYEKLRNYLISEKTITSLIQLEYSGFDGATVPICTFTLENFHYEDFKGGYIRLSDFRGAENQGPKTLEAIKNPECGWFYRASAADFKKIPGSPIAYWVSEEVRISFKIGETFSRYAEPRLGMATGNNDMYVRNWFEVLNNKIGLGLTRDLAKQSNLKWFPYNKGGDYRKWFGNNEYIVNWENDGYELQNTLHPSGSRIWAHNFNLNYIFKPAITWTFVSSSCFGVRQSPQGFLFDVAGSSAFPDESEMQTLMGLLGSKVAFLLLKALNPTLNFQAGNLSDLPVVSLNHSTKIRTMSIVNNLVDICKSDWDSYETSWDFTILPLLKPEYNQSSIQETYNNIRTHWREMTLEMQRLEEENNRIFIEAYGLQDELTPEVPLSEITLTCNPYYRYGGARSEEELERLLLLDTIKEYISYAVGCMLGRYSLDKEGLVFAGGNFDLSQYETFPADRDNVIPILAEDYFKDDIVTRFVDFVRLTFGSENLEENLDFIADTLGRKASESARDSIRRYFVYDFYKDHLKTYKKRPIYWMFSSGKEKAFNCLIYLHRYQPDTIATIRTEYLHRLQEALEVEKQHLQRVIDEEAGTRAARNAVKSMVKLDKQIAELKKYEELIHHYADMGIAIDLDDGVKVNYAKFDGLLAKI